MNTLQFGPLFFPTKEGPEALELARMADDLGYDYFWVPDYVTLPYLDAFVLLAAAARETKNVRLGTAVTLAPFRSPFQMFKDAASVDVLSDGRLTLGVGIGAVARDFEIAQVDFHKRGRISDEYIDITRRLLAGENVDYDGEFYSFKDLTMGPRPVQQPVPIWIGANGMNGFPKGVLRRAGRLGDGFFPTETPVERFRDAQATIKEHAEAAGRDPESIGWGLLTWGALADSREEGIKTAEREIGARLNKKHSVNPGGGYAVGRPEDMIATIESFAEIGVTNFVLDPGCHPRDIRTLVETFAKEVMPHFRK